MAKFKTRARALDLLGRQQIAGIPTAINELIKNAHDAYADRMDIDFIRSKLLLVLRDDGMGMTREEFENRWLILGTESKLKRSNSLPPVDTTKPLRHIMGEKGIGRLAIASIGNQVLILTKAKRNVNSKIVASFINWQLFEIPGINIEDIAIPVKEFDKLPTVEDIKELQKEVLDSLDALKKLALVEDGYYEKIKHTIQSFVLDISQISSHFAGEVDLAKVEGGTQFYISPVNDVIFSDIDERDDPNEATKIEKMLMGFHNTMTPNHPQPQLKIEFRDHRKDDGSYVNLIDEENFFTPEEFELADHHFHGRFDEYGQFKGVVRIYGEKVFEHTVSWSENQYRETACGPFEINLAYLQGELKSSRVSAEDYARIRAKGDKFGGLYIYRNNIRILPYGDSDYDFLDIEKNRSKRAATYFFSYRRMFGAIDVQNQDKSGLLEKAGREGFIENKAYKQLQSILKNFFRQLVADFFKDSSNSAKAEFFLEKKDYLNACYAALEQRDKLVKIKKEKFGRSLENFFKRLVGHEFEREVNQILSCFEQDIAAATYLPALSISGK